MRGCLLVETLIKMHKSLQFTFYGIDLNSVSSPGYTVLLDCTLLCQSIFRVMCNLFHHAMELEYHMLYFSIGFLNHMSLSKFHNSTTVRNHRPL